MDARVLREVRELSRFADVTSAAFGPSPVEGVEHIELRDKAPYVGGLWARARYILAFVAGAFGGITRRSPRDADAAALLAGMEWDVIIANDVTSLALAARLRSAQGFIADLHEYSPRQAEESLLFRLTEARYFTWLLRTYLPRAAATITVSEGIADEYRRNFGVDCAVVTNAAEFVELTPGEVGGTLRVVHSAAPSAARRIEVMIDAVIATHTPMTLDLFLVDNGSTYLGTLRERIRATDRVKIHAAVPQTELIQTLSKYDIGVHLLPPINFNHKWALPNKIFDYVQARLAVIIGPSPEMQRIVGQFGLGAVAEDFTVSALTRVFDSIDASKVWAWKVASDEAARTLSAEEQMARLSGVVRNVLDGGR